VQPGEAVVKRLVRGAVARYRPALLYRNPASSLQPERLYLFLDTLWRTRRVDGAVLEVGCWLGGTSAIASGLLQRTGYGKRYVCIDTFSGFVPEQFDRDREHGTPEDSRRLFTATSLQMVRTLLDHWGRPEVELVQGDIVSLPDELLPDKIAACLLDVDLDLPTYEALARIYPRLSLNGTILVDDCPERTPWAGARVAYKRFVEENGLPERYEMGMGVIVRDESSARA
jgi:O-methyltransferase